MLEGVATPQQVDDALERFGFAMGPFAVSDLAGLDIAYRSKRERNLRGAGVAFRQSRIPDLLVECGRLGQKTGAGYYRYESGKRERHPDPVVEELLYAERQRLGIAAHAPSDEEIIERCTLALVNEGARILTEGIAVRASDVDLVYLNGYGFPARRGGPMCYANEVGLANVVRALRRFADEPGADASWQPAPLLVQLAEDGKTFA
ncbi:MAG: 3-hydroxyacyl-CoA dehydrogenase family protein [Pseudomonadota bacterium]|nr:3-hydroxyacyl-CoA dehydrogenase family protein [Pseudomonadota bacterium]